MADSKEQIRKFLVDKVVDVPLTEDTKLFTTGLLDSFSVLELISFLEETFNVEIDTRRHELIEFDSIVSIERLLLALKAS